MNVLWSSDMRLTHPACHCPAENGVSVPGESSESMGQALDDSFRIAYLQVGPSTNEPCFVCVDRQLLCSMLSFHRVARTCTLTSGQEASCSAGLEHACCLSTLTLPQLLVRMCYQDLYDPSKMCLHACSSFGMCLLL